MEKKALIVEEWKYVCLPREEEDSSEKTNWFVVNCAWIGQRCRISEEELAAPPLDEKKERWVVWQRGEEIPTVEMKRVWER